MWPCVISGCSRAIVPTQSLNSITIAQLGCPTLNITYLLIADTINTSAIFKFNETNQQVNSSHCNISSLEVYRGMEQATEISHDGFSLSNNSNIEVTMIKLPLHYTSMLFDNH